MGEELNNNNEQKPSIDVVAAEKAIKGGDITFIVLIIIFVTSAVVGIIDGCAKDDIYPNFSSSHYINIAQSKVKSKLNYPSTAKFSFWEAEPYEENGVVYVMASGKCTAKNAFGLELSYMCYVKFKIDLQANTYEAYEPIISDW